MAPLDPLSWADGLARFLSQPAVWISGCWPNPLTSPHCYCSTLSLSWKNPKHFTVTLLTFKRHFYSRMHHFVHGWFGNASFFLPIWKDWSVRADSNWLLHARLPECSKWLYCIEGIVNSEWTTMDFKLGILKWDYCCYYHLINYIQWIDSYPPLIWLTIAKKYSALNAFTFRYPRDISVWI